MNLDGTLNVASPASREPIRSTDDLISRRLSNRTTPLAAILTTSLSTATP
ncbi:hypothetical protein IU399_18895 [Salmonella enterica subsp. enterica serovar Worthington]|nr:hypothetical protein [Salmonella enterica subsp. enterica serovar Worthington]